MILVTGATGFVGKSVMKALAEREMPAKPYTGRINDPHALRTQLADVDTVIHLAGAESKGRARALQHVDVEGAARLLEECRHAQVRRLLVVSRLNADANSMHPLLRAKGEQEELVRRSDLPYTIIRSATLFGRHDRFLNNIVGLAQWSWPLIWLPGGGRVIMQPLWVEDLVRCLLLTLARYDLIGRTISLGGAEQMRYVDIVQAALASAGISGILFKPHPLLVRPLTGILFSWWRHPAVTRFWMDRFTTPDITDLDSVHFHFGFYPDRLRHNIAYLRRSHLRWQLIGLRLPA